jgi:hypothetical protein
MPAIMPGTTPDNAALAAHLAAVTGGAQPAGSAPPAPAPAGEAGDAAKPPRTAKSIDDIKAARAAAAGGASGAGAVPAAAGTSPAGDQGAKPPATAEVDISADELGRFSKLSTAKRAADAKVAELAPLAEQAKVLIRAKALIAEGKHLAAMELLGLDIDRAVAENLGSAPPPDPKLKAIEDRQAELDRKLSDRDKEDEAARGARGAAARAQLHDRVAKDTATYPILSTDPGLVDRAMSETQVAYESLMAQRKEEKIPGDLSTAEKQKLIDAGLAEAEERETKAFEKRQKAIEARKAGGQSGNGQQGSSSAANGSGLTIDRSSLGNAGASASSTPRRKLTFEQLRTERQRRR